MKDVVFGPERAVMAYVRHRAVQPSCYLDLGENESRIAPWLEARGITPVPREPYEERFVNEFGRAYAAFVGRIGLTYDSLEWWLTCVSAKNRFTSRLSHHLSRLLRVQEALTSMPDGTRLLLIDPPEEIRNSLERLLQQAGVRPQAVGLFASRFRHRAQAFTLGVLSVLAAVSRSWRRQWHVRPLIRQLSTRLRELKPCYVVKTFVYDHAVTPDGGYRDAFFGSLPRYLRQRWPTLILGNIMGDYRKTIHRLAPCEDLVVPVEYFLRLADPLLAVVRVFGKRVKIREPLEFFGLDVGETVNAEVARTYMSPTAVEDYLHFVCVRRLTQQVPLETFLLTCENNPWERMCILALRRYAPRVKIIGYQHSVVTRASANMFLSPEEIRSAPLPDCIITVGGVPKQIIERYGCLGADRLRVGCALRSESLFRLAPQPRRSIRCILVALEGVRDVFHLVNYALRELADHPEFAVTIRTHPLLPLERLAHLIRYDLLKSSHIRFSHGRTLQQDLEEADVVIYWGSTVGAEALLLSKPVIHFDRGDLFSYDPLFECRALKWVVTAADRLINVIQEINGLSDAEYEVRQRVARKYLGDYFHPVTEERLAAFLSA